MSYVLQICLTLCPYFYNLSRSLDLECLTFVLLIFPTVLHCALHSMIEPVIYQDLLFPGVAQDMRIS
jgi:hypothetical protein